MKLQEKLKVRELRLQAISIKDIATLLNVSPSSISNWTRDIDLTVEQVDRINTKAEIGRRKARQTNISVWRNKRKDIQEQGRKLLTTCEDKNLLISGSMLYWAEGAKSRTDCKLSNSDPDMLIYFKKFLDQCFGLHDSNYTLICHCYTDLHSVEEIEDYWLNILYLPRTCLRKWQINNKPISSKHDNRNKLEWGTMHLGVVGKGGIVQQIYGLIQEITGINKESWLD